jgi:hypothetical protein
LGEHARHPIRRSRGVAAVAFAAVCLPAAALAAPDSEAPRGPAKPLPNLSAHFTQRSYLPGQTATVSLRSKHRVLTLQVLRAGAERAWNSVGKPWGPPQTIQWNSTGRAAPLRVRVGDWSSGLYFLRITTRNRRVTYAPFVVRAAQPGSWSRVAVVLPTHTWQSYNHWDANQDGTGDTWYARQSIKSVNLQRPYINQGKPPYYRSYDRAFLRFLTHRGHRAEYLTEDDFDTFASGDDLARLYDLIVFVGHHEYKTVKAFDLTERYRDLGGNLAFLSANNFYWRVDLKQNRIWRIKKFRDLGRPEARLIGVQYRANDRGQRLGTYVVVDRGAAPWLFTGLPFENGQPLGTIRYGIEFDMVTPDSPPETRILAEVNPGMADPSIRGHMTYYATPAGAKVFAAGTLGFGGSDNPFGHQLFANLWAHLTQP